MCEQEDQMAGIIEAFKELQEDNVVPKNVKAKLKEILKTLQSNCELEIKVNKALDELDQIANDSNLQAYTRTQIWNVASLLEMF